ncbi:discoidin domain-containing protein [Sphingobacterium sp. SRCM116780]|uniref:discoidin domain-containing protein n=1 Tax=Sphingobacterium sp. SRCM116780 TaxID=2907623 RepID=UPI001F401D91|nr:discoidin domain-containing protein [Sphingobacterium sp. SRCM116780]UIR55378.1 discoidin domain-containing protein [Sphingobacterium sp. SRCM116780]
MRINQFVLFGGMLLALNACKEEELVFPKNVNQEIEITEKRPTAKPANLTFVSDFNQTIEIYWPELSERVTKAVITYKEGTEVKKIEVTKFDEATILHLDEMKEYDFDLQYFTSEGTSSKTTSVKLSPRPFEADYKILNLNAQPIAGGVSFIFPKTSTREIPGTITYSFNGKSYEKEIKGNIADTVNVVGLTDETQEIAFAITLNDAKWTREAKGTKQLAPGLLVYKLILPSLLAYMEGNNAVVSWKNNTGDPVDVQVNYKLNGVNKTAVVNASTETTGKLSFDVGGNATILNVTLSTDGSTSPVQIIPVKPLTEIAKTGWTAEVSSTENNEGAANGKGSSLIDGDINTYWHSNWSGPGSNYPHWFIIDFGQIETIGKFGMIRRHNNATGGFKTFNVEVSLDGQNWTEVGKNLNFNSSDSPAAWQDYTLAAVKAKYIRITMTAPMNSATSTHLAEFRVSGY